jgi:hypothetical protein
MIHGMDSGIQGLPIPVFVSGSTKDVAILNERGSAAWFCSSLIRKDRA